ncbi:MAG: alpha/beta fold hydrolase [Actinomycetota bacterium]|nr:alpha/beta fold hydrolase [Actinomycetota bacterium]
MPDGVLCLHGFTGTPHSMQGISGALSCAGFEIGAPLLPGHGTTIDDMMGAGWDDWLGAAEEAYADLAARVGRVVVCGLSMGGTLAVALAAAHLEIAGIVAVNPYVDPPAPSFRELIQGVLDSGETVAPAIGSDIADPGAQEVGSYGGTPLRPLLSLCRGLDELFGRLGDITSPLLLMTSRQDHVVPTVSSDLLAGAVSGPVERIWLERSFHVATLDFDRDEIERRAVEFALKCCHS